MCSHERYQPTVADLIRSADALASYNGNCQFCSEMLGRQVPGRIYNTFELTEDGVDAYWFTTLYCDDHAADQNAVDPSTIVVLAN